MNQIILDNKIEKLAMVLLIAFIITTCLTLFTRMHLFWTGLEDSPIYSQFNLQMKFVHYLYYLFTLSVSIGSAIWLFIVAKESNSHPWLWAFLGLFASLFAVLLWYLKKICNCLEIEKDKTTKAT